MTTLLNNALSTKMASLVRVPKRKLTSDEIKSIIDVIPRVCAASRAVAEHNHNEIRKRTELQLSEIEIVPSQIPKLRALIYNRCLRAASQAGDTVGLQAAEAIGAPVTQATLNSVSWETEVIYVQDGLMYTSPIGKLVDESLENARDKVKVTVDEKATEYLDVSESGMFILSVDEKGLTDWYEIEGVTRHLPGGNLLRVTTASGRSVVATRAKSFIVWDDVNKAFLPKDGADLKVGDLLPTVSSAPLPSNSINLLTSIDTAGVFSECGETDSSRMLPPNVKFDSEFGFIVGCFVANSEADCGHSGCLTISGLSVLDVVARIAPWCAKHSVSLSLCIDSVDGSVATATLTSKSLLYIITRLTVSDSQVNVPHCIFMPINFEFIFGFLDGFFSAFPLFEAVEKEMVVDFKGREKLLNNIVLILSCVGIFAKLQGTKIIISVSQFAKYVRLTSSPRRNAMYTSLESPLSPKALECVGRCIFDPVVSIEDVLVDDSTRVYDFTVATTRNFVLANGLGVRDSFHHSGSTDVGGSGLQIFSELLTLSQNRKIPRVEIHFKNHQISYRDAVNLSRAFVAVSVRSLLTHPVSGIEFVQREDGEEVPPFYDMFTAYMRHRRRDASWTVPQPESGSVLPFLRLNFSPYKLFSARVTTSEIARTIELLGGTQCVYSPTFMGIVDVYGVPYGRRKPVCTIKPTEFIKVPQVSGADAVDAAELEFRKGAEPSLGEIGGKGAVTKVLHKVSDKGRAADAKRVEKITKPQKDKKPKQKHSFEKKGEGKGESALEKRLKAAVAEKLKADAKEADEDADEANSASMPPPDDTAGINPQNAPVLFLQTCVVPRIRDDSFVVSSQVAQCSVSKLLKENEIVPTNAKLLSLFRRVEIVVTRTLEIARGATRISDKEWRVWISTPAVFAKCVPREKIVGLFTNVYPDAVVTLVYNPDTGDDWVSLVFPFPKEENPFTEVQAKVMSASASFIREVRENLKTASTVSRPPELIWGEYVSLRGKMNYSPVLSNIISHPAIDGRTTFSNNFREMCSVRGIEAARASILKEFYDVIIATGSSIVPRNVQIVVDVMTSSGTLMQFTARGSVRQQLGAYSESSFEQALSAFKRSAVSGAPETVSATSTSILTGSLVTLGTGVCRVVPEDGVYRPPPYLQKAHEEDAASAVPAAAAPPVDIIEPRQRAVLGGDDTPAAAADRAAEVIVAPIVTFGSRLHPPDDADFMIGVMTTRDFAKLVGLV